MLYRKCSLLLSDVTVVWTQVKRGGQTARERERLYHEKERLIEN